MDKISAVYAVFMSLTLVGKVYILRAFCQQMANKYRSGNVKNKCGATGYTNKSYNTAVELLGSNNFGKRHKNTEGKKRNEWFIKHSRFDIRQLTIRLKALPFVWISERLSYISWVCSDKKSIFQVNAVERESSGCRKSVIFFVNFVSGITRNVTMKICVFEKKEN